MVRTPDAVKPLPVNSLQSLPEEVLTLFRSLWTITKTRQLTAEANVVFIISTHGEGEPPAMAEDFHGFITGKRAPQLPNLNYSVVALGDKSYKLFCKTGIDIDQALAKSGAKSILPILTLDVDF